MAETTLDQARAVLRERFSTAATAQLKDLSNGCGHPIGTEAAPIGKGAAPIDGQESIAESICYRDAGAIGTIGTIGTGKPHQNDGPHEPCPKCGGRAFWRPSVTGSIWRCRRCVPPLPNVWLDGVFLP